MDAAELLVPPGGVRPGHLGLIATGRVILGDIAATAVDLSLRGLLQIDSTGGEAGGWVLTPAEPPQDGLDALEYEQVLLEWVARPGYGAVGLASLATDLPAGLAEVREGLVRDAVHHGWLRRLHHHERTKAGEELASQLRAFRQELRQARAARGPEILDGQLLPAYTGTVLQGKLDITALRTITGQIDAKLAIFVEDEFAELMVTTALRYYGNVEIDAIKVHRMGGAGPAMKVSEQHNLDPTAAFPSICLLDGDQSGSINPARRIYALPGDTAPEAHVFARVLDRLDILAAKVTVSMQLPASQQDRVREVVRERALTNRDRHVIWEQIGESLDFTSGYTVKTAFLAVWAQEYPDEVRELIDSFQDLVPER
jgi:hypothetical protein